MVDDELKKLIDVSESDSETLANYISRFIEEAEQKLSEENIGEVEYRTLTVNDDGTFVYRLDRGKPITEFISRNTEFLEYDETYEFAEYLAEEYSFFQGADPMAVSRHFFINLLRDAFGPHGERIGNSRNRLNEIENRVQADIVGRPRQRTRCLLAGIKVPEDIKLSDSCWLRSPNPGEVIYEEVINVASVMGIGTTNPGFATAILEMETVEDEEAMNEVSTSKTRFYTSLLRLYGGANTHDTLSINEPISYDILGSRSSNRNNRSNNPKYIFNAIDKSRFNRLCNLLDDYYQDSEFNSPVSLPLEHLDDSLERRVSFQDSISFSIIGIESLYKQYTEGTTTNSDVGRYCGLLLSQVSREMDALSVKSTIERAYGIRNTWAHGGKAESNASKKLQNMLWDYLRSSIVVFAWLDQQDILSSDNLDIESALIDEQHRNRIKTQLEGLEIKDYLPLR